MKQIEKLDAVKSFLDIMFNVAKKAAYQLNETVKLGKLRIEVGMFETTKAIYDGKKLSNPKNEEIL